MTIPLDMNPPSAQTDSIAAAVRAVFAFATYARLAVSGMVIGEHADGSGRWHVIASCADVLGSERTARVLIDADGADGSIELIAGYR